MPSYSLIEYKLRRYFYLGHEYSMYIPTSIRTSFWEQQQHHRDDVTGVRIIGKIIKKNKVEEINSIVPIILKIKKEDKLYDDRLLIFALAICARFNLKQCVKMVADAYTAVSSICTDGLKLLMFVKFCRDVSVILHNEGYLPKVSSGFGKGFRKAMNKWYLSRDPLLTTEQIVRNKHYDGWSHKDVMKLIHIQSDDPSRQIIIIHTLHGMKKVEELFGSKANDIQIDNKNETFENIQLKFIYNYLKQVNSMKNMDESTLRNEIELNRWGHEYKVIPQHMLKNTTILTSLVMHMPLRDLLDNTFFFAKNKLFANASPDLGLWEFILRFNNTVQLRKHHIHPIESYLEYVKYSRTFINILKLQNSILKKQSNHNIELPENKLKVFINISKKKSSSNDNSSLNIKNTISEKKCEIQSTVTNVNNMLSQASPSNSQVNYTQQSKNSEDLNPSVNSIKKNAPLSKFDSKLLKQKSSKSCKNKSKNNQTSKKVHTLIEPEVLPEQNKNEQENAVGDISNQLSTLTFNIQQTNSDSKLVTENQIESEMNVFNQNLSNTLVLLKPPPKLVEKLLKFLSEDLIRKTLQILNPTGRRVIIAYDNRSCMKKYMCTCTRLLSVHEAITLVTLSLIVPEKLPNKPTVCGVNETSQIDKIEIIEWDQTFATLEAILFKMPSTGCESDSDKKDIPIVNPLSVMNWAKENNKEYDVFVFLGTNKMNFKNIKLSIKEYQNFSKKPVKIIVCCLNGKHVEQRNLSRGNMLFISGFDKNVGKIINSFINEEF